MRKIKYKVAYKTERQDTEKEGWVISKAFTLTSLQPGGETSQFDFSDGGYLGTDDIGWEDLIWLEYTGLKDKNGKEIYEGDIVKWSSWKLGSKDLSGNLREPAEIDPVVWNPEGFWSCRKDSSFYMGIYTNIEVIGNIYENPELIK